MSIPPTTPPPIDNVIFDLGGVLIEWHPEAIAAAVFPNPEDAQRVVREVFRHERWRRFDAGKLTLPEAVAHFSNAAGVTAPEMEHLFHAYMGALVPFPYTRPLIEHLHGHGLRLFVLSNIHGTVMDHLERAFDFWHRFEGVVASGKVGLSKPDPRIFDSLLTLYGLEASRTLLVDDTPSNLRGAEGIGIRGVLFRDASSLPVLRAALPLGGSASSWPAP